MPELLTRRQLETVDALYRAGTAKGAAHALGVRPATVEQTLARARVRAGVDTTLQLAVDLARRGEL